MAGPELAVVIPALNEAATIGDIVQKLIAFGSVVVVDDGSSDGTGDIARGHGADVVVHRQNAGYDAALNSGFARAAEMGAQFVLTVDADGEHPSAMIPRFIEALRAGNGLSLVVRDRLPRVGELIFSLVTRPLYGIRDPLCGMKGYRMEFYGQLGHFDSYGSVGTELMLYAVRHGAKPAQIPFKTGQRQDAPRFGRAFRANMKILRALMLGLVRTR
jgi:glycosyltransferase involved in cell wall biosynthesis